MCPKCDAFWGVMPAKGDLPPIAFFHTGEEMRAIQKALADLVDIDPD